jgi:hypothetical protein
MKHPKLLGLMFMALTLFVNQSCKKDEACEEKTWYHDGDADGEGDSGDTKKACDKPDEYVANANDPDDTSADIFSNCTKITYYLDDDGDTYGNPDEPLTLCDGVAAPDKYVTDNTDSNDSDAKDFPGCETVTYYLDNDGDTFGDPDQALELCDGVTVPEKYVTDNTDCDDSKPEIYPDVEVAVYLDNDGDGFGHPETSQTVSICNIPDNYVSNDTDCNDNDANINPGIEDSTEDGVDHNCDGYDSNIWTGPNKMFSKDKNDDWTDPQYQDMITEKVTFTRQDNDYLFNLTWWEDNIGDGTPIHGQNTSDLGWEFWGASKVQPFSNVTGHNPTGGPKGIRWALLDTGDYPTQAWQDFQLYGTLGDNTHFYSLNNIASIAGGLNSNILVSGVNNDFDINGYVDPKIAHLIGKTLGVWLVEEDIYFTLKITEWTLASESGTITYERSTPFSL